MSDIRNAEQASIHEPGAATAARSTRALFSWRTMCRLLFVAACLATLVGLFYAVENWRGRHAWQECRRDLEARGEVIDWNAYIPGSVPDEQNIYKAPRMAEWFVKGSMAQADSNGFSKSGSAREPFSLPARRTAQTDSVPVAEVAVDDGGI